MIVRCREKKSLGTCIVNVEEKSKENAIFILYCSSMQPVLNTGKLLPGSCV